MFCEADAEAGAVRLADAGLLAPDLPEGTGDVFLEDGDCEVSASKGSHKVRLRIEDTRLTSEEAREMAYALLAAANYSQEGNRE